jgi:hypothetical protein
VVHVRRFSRFGKAERERAEISDRHRAARRGVMRDA